MKNFIFAILITLPLTSCSGVSGEYKKINIGYLGMDNSVSSYEFSQFGTVKYSLSTSGSRSSNSYNSYDGKYKLEGNRLILNFGGSDRILTLSEDKTTITDSEGDSYKK